MLAVDRNETGEGFKKTYAGDDGTHCECGVCDVFLVMRVCRRGFKVWTDCVLWYVGEVDCEGGREDICMFGKVRLNI